MRALVRLTILVGILAVTSPARAAGSGMRAPLHLTSTHMVSPSVGWAVANNVIFRTSDGGQNWLDVTPCGLPGQYQLDTFFLSSTIAWAAITAANGQGPISVFRTMDGGRTWTASRVSITSGGEPSALLSFPNQRDGWMLVIEGVAAGSAPYILFQTIDGGTHWTIVAYSTFHNASRAAFPFCDCTRAVTFRGSSVGWATGEPFATPQVTWLYVSHDAGHTWRHQALPVPRGYSVVQTFAPIFFGRQIGILPVQLGGPHAEAAFVAYRTRDGGATWNGTTPIALAQGFPTLTFSFIDPRHGWISSGSRLYHTDTGGQRWSTIHVRGAWGAVSSIQFLSRRLGFALQGQMPTGTGARNLLKTTDGGSTWHRVPAYSLALPLHRC